jgi:hypothetical protein
MGHDVTGHRMRWQLGIMRGQPHPTQGAVPPISGEDLQPSRSIEAVTGLAPYGWWPT